MDPAAAAAALVPRNGFRYDGAGRSFETTPGTSATNVVVEGRDPVALHALLARVRDGLYVGRIWYTYPINGLRAGDFTCTVVGDSFIIRDGSHRRAAQGEHAAHQRQRDAPARERCSAPPRTRADTLVWGADEIVYAPRSR